MAYLSEKRRTRAKNWARHHIARASGQVQADAVRRPRTRDARRTDVLTGGKMVGDRGVCKGWWARRPEQGAITQLALGDRVRTEPPPHRSVSLIQTTCPPKDASKTETRKRETRHAAPGPPAPFPCHSPRQHGMRDAMSIGQSVGRPSLALLGFWALGPLPSGLCTAHSLRLSSFSADLGCDDSGTASERAQSCCSSGRMWSS